MIGTGGVVRARPTVTSIIGEPAMMNRSMLLAALLMVGAGVSLAQPPADAQRDAMKKLQFLVGEWKGEGWMEFAPGERRTFKAQETVLSKLDGLVLAIDGLHRGKVGGQGDDVIVHNAFGVIHYDAPNRKYRFRAHTARGNHEDAEAAVSDGQISWGMKIPQFGDVRYTIQLDDKGRWSEVGEVTRDGKSRKFFEMTLERAATK